MATIRGYTTKEQSRKLAVFLPIESADMWWDTYEDKPRLEKHYHEYLSITIDPIPTWSLAALLNILHSRQNDIPSLSGGGYRDGNYIQDWCLDYEFGNGNYQKTFADNPVDAAYKMIMKLHELKLL